MKKKIPAIILLCCMCVSLCACQKNETEYNTLSDLNGKTIAAEMGSIYASYIYKNPNLSDANVSYALSGMDCLAQLLSGKADAYATDNLVARNLVSQHEHIKIIDEPLNSGEYGFAFQQGSDLCGEFSEAIRSMKADGTIDEIAAKWIAYGKTLPTVMEQDWPSTRTVSCLLDPSVEPLCFTNDAGEFVGIDVDVLVHAAKMLGYKIEFSLCLFNEILPRVVAGLADIGCSALTISSDRDTFVDFAESYLPDNAVLLVRDIQESTYEGTILSVENSIRRVFLEENRLNRWVKGFLLTIEFCLITICLGTLFGSGLFILDYNIGGVFHLISSALNKFLGLIPYSTWVFFIYYVVFNGNFVSNWLSAIVAFTVTFGLDTFGLLGRCVDSVSIGEKEAAKSMGYSKLKALLKIYLPQNKGQIIGTMCGMMVGHIKISSLIELISVPEFQTVADTIRAETSEPYITLIFVAIIYALLSFITQKIMNRLAARFAVQKTEEQIRRSIEKGGK